LAGIAFGEKGMGVKVDGKGKANAQFDSVASEVFSQVLQVVSKNYSDGDLGTGFALTQDADTGCSSLVIDRLTVRKIAQFIELQIKKLSYVGGEIIVSPASMTCCKVEELDNAYRCYMKNEDESQRIKQEFKAGDQARCQTFNLVEMDGMKSNTYYWRLVTEIGDDYIDLSKEDCDDGSTIPTADDFICQLGNRDDASRQHAIIISSVGEDAPSIKQYSGIDSYSLIGKECTVLSPSGNKLVGDFYSSSSETKTITEIVDEVSENVSNMASVNASNRDDIEKLGANVEDLMNQSDQEMCVWFYEGEPSMENAPAVEWTDISVIESHDQDIFYSTDEGRAWRFEVGDGAAVWNEITDKQTLKALEKAAAAQDAADSAVAKTEENTTSINRNTERIELLAKNVVTTEATEIETSSGIVTTSSFNGLFSQKKENGEVVARADIFTEITEDGLSKSVINSDLINLKGKVTLNDITDDKGNTVIEGGKIKTDLLDVDTIMGETGVFSGSMVTQLVSLVDSDAEVILTEDNYLKCKLQKNLNILTGDSDDEIYNYDIILPSTGEEYIGAHVYVVNKWTPPYTRVVGGQRYTSLATEDHEYFIGISQQGDTIVDEEPCNKMSFMNGIVELIGVKGKSVYKMGVLEIQYVRWCVVGVQCSVVTNLMLSD
jgi:hypothetical protein